MFDKIIAALKAMFHPDVATRDGERAHSEIAAALDKKAKGLAWRTSIVDLLKTLELDSSLEGRRVLAKELGYAIPFDGSAKDNMWLHDRVLSEVNRHGIKIP